MVLFVCFKHKIHVDWISIYTTVVILHFHKQINFNIKEKKMKKENLKQKLIN